MKDNAFEQSIINVIEDVTCVLIVPVLEGDFLYNRKIRCGGDDRQLLLAELITTSERSEFKGTTLTQVSRVDGVYGSYKLSDIINVTRKFVHDYPKYVSNSAQYTKSTTREVTIKVKSEDVDSIAKLVTSVSEGSGAQVKLTSSKEYYAIDASANGPVKYVNVTLTIVSSKIIVDYTIALVIKVFNQSKYLYTVVPSENNVIVDTGFRDLKTVDAINKCVNYEPVEKQIVNHLTCSYDIKPEVKSEEPVLKTDVEGWGVRHEK